MAGIFCKLGLHTKYHKNWQTMGKQTIAHYSTIPNFFIHPRTHTQRWRNDELFLGYTSHWKCTQGKVCHTFLLSKFLLSHFSCVSLLSQLTRCKICYISFIPDLHILEYTFLPFLRWPDSVDSGVNHPSRQTAGVRITVLSKGSCDPALGLWTPPLVILVNRQNAGWDQANALQLHHTVDTPY